MASSCWQDGIRRNRRLGLGPCGRSDAALASFPSADRDEKRERKEGKSRNHRCWLLCFSLSHCSLAYTRCASRGCDTTSLLCRPPPINRDDLPCNITRTLRCQEQHRRCQFPWLTNAPHRCCSRHNCLGSIQNSLRHAGSKHSRRDGVHTKSQLAHCPHF